MANRITMTICGQEYTLVADENSTYMERVGTAVNEKMTELMENSHVSRSDAAVLTAINLVDELFKAQVTMENLRQQVKTYVDEASAAKNETSDLKRQLFKLQQNNQRR